MYLLKFWVDAKLKNPIVLFYSKDRLEILKKIKTILQKMIQDNNFINDILTKAKKQDLIIAKGYYLRIQIKRIK